MLKSKLLENGRGQYTHMTLGIGQKEAEIKQIPYKTAEMAKKNAVTCLLTPERELMRTRSMNRIS